MATVPPWVLHSRPCSSSTCLQPGDTCPVKARPCSLGSPQMPSPAPSASVPAPGPTPPGLQQHLWPWCVTDGPPCPKTDLATGGPSPVADWLGGASGSSLTPRAITVLTAQHFTRTVPGLLLGLQTMTWHPGQFQTAGAYLQTRSFVMNVFQNIVHYIIKLMLNICCSDQLLC